MLDEKQCLLNDSYGNCSQEGSAAYDAIETLLKGPEVDLPEGVSFKDKDGHVRHSARIKWWTAVHVDKKDRLNLGSDVTDEHKIDQVYIDDSHSYSAAHPPVFVGHYWLNQDVPIPLSSNCACLDYSIANEGKLVAYLWRGESELKESSFEWCR